MRSDTSLICLWLLGRGWSRAPPLWKADSLDAHLGLSHCTLPVGLPLRLLKGMLNSYWKISRKHFMLISLHLLEEASRESYVNYCVLEKNVEGDFPAQGSVLWKQISKQELFFELWNTMQSNFSSHQPFPWEAARPFLIICSVTLSLSSLIQYISAEVLQPDTLDFSLSCQTHNPEISLYPKSVLWSGKWETVHPYLKHSPIDRSFFFLGFKSSLLAYTLTTGKIAKLLLLASLQRDF